MKEGEKMKEVANINAVMQRETFTFSEAIHKVSDGAKVRRLEWKDISVYGVLKAGRLSIFIGGKVKDWIVNDGDMNGVDWVVVK